jgi:hypothetical protein
MMNFFWCFWFTIQNTTTPQVRNLFSVIAVIISFPLVRAAAAAAAADFCCCCCAPPLHPAPLYFRAKGSTKERKLPVAPGLAFGHACVGVGVVEVAVQCKHYTGEI